MVTVGILVAGLGVPFTGRYPRGLYDVLVGVARSRGHPFQQTRSPAGRERSGG
jgi:hypothetical protein